MHKKAVIGIGNELRGDDALGLIVARQLQEKVAGGCVILEQNGDITPMLESFCVFQMVLIVDAIMRQGATAGMIIRIDAKQQSLSQCALQSSSHAVDIGQTIEMARALNQLPERLIVFGIVGKNFSLNHPLSDDVKEAIPQLMTTILNELNLTNEGSEHA